MMIGDAQADITGAGIAAGDTALEAESGWCAVGPAC